MLENSNTRVSCSKIDSYGNFLGHFKLVDLQTLCIGWKLIREDRKLFNHVIQRPEPGQAFPYPATGIVQLFRIIEQIL